MRKIVTRLAVTALATVILAGNGQVMALHCSDDQAQERPWDYATAISLGQSVNVSLSETNDDVDLYSFVAPATCSYTLKISNNDVGIAKIYCPIRNTYGITLGSNYTADTDVFTNEFEVDLTEGETYYVWAWTSEVNSRANYQFVVTYTSVLEGWQMIDGSWRYFISGEQVTGWKKIGDKWYFFDQDGIMQTGWFRSPGNGKWYYLHPTGGSMMTDTWITSSGMWYYLDSDGSMVTGWQNIGGKWYYFNPNGGAMVKGWLKIGSSWYYLNPNGGAMMAGWQSINGKWYYFTSGGAMKTGWFSYGGNWYYFKGTGEMATGELQIGNTIYYFTPSGIMAEG